MAKAAEAASPPTSTVCQAVHRAVRREPPLDEAEQEQSQQGHDHGAEQSGGDRAHEEIGSQRHQTPSHIREGDGEAVPGTAGSGPAMPSSNFIMKSTHRFRSERIAPTTAVTVSSGRP